MSTPAIGTTVGLSLMPYHSILQEMGLISKSGTGRYNYWDYYYQNERLISCGYSRDNGIGVQAYIYTKESPINKCSRKIDIESSDFSKELREMLLSARHKPNGELYNNFALNIGVVYELDSTNDKRHFKTMIQQLIDQIDGLTDTSIQMEDVVLWPSTLLERILEQKNIIQF